MKKNKEQAVLNLIDIEDGDKIFVFEQGPGLVIVKFKSRFGRCVTAILPKSLIVGENQIRVLVLAKSGRKVKIEFDVDKRRRFGIVNTDKPFQCWVPKRLLEKIPT